MKYINADRLKAEITGWRNKQMGFAWDAVNEVLNIIASLQQEQPEVDLENYLENYFKGWHIEEEIGLTKPDGWSCIVKDIKGIARHFYELGLNARKEE